MADPYAKLERSIDGVASAVKSLDRTSSKTTRELQREQKRHAFDVDLLTSEEVDELRRLIRHKGQLETYSSTRIKEGGERVRGMYLELGKIGAVTVDMEGVCVFLSPMAYWAVEKHEQRERDRNRAVENQWRHDFCIAGFSAFVGGLLGILGTLLGVMLG